MQKLGYDIALQGLRGAPAFPILVNEQAHASVWSAFSVLGIDRQEITAIPTGDMGRMHLDAIPELTQSTLIVAQAGNVTGGSFDHNDAICDIAQ